MEPLELFMQGAELRDPDRFDPQPLDFAVWNEEVTLLALTDWWTIPWGVGVGLVVVGAPLNPETLLFEGLSDALRVASPSDGFFELRCQQARRRMDLERVKYLKELQALIEFESDFDFGPWIEVVRERPVVNPLEVYEREHSGMRAVGRICVLDDRGTPVDALAIDERGDSAAADEAGWLALFGEQWSGYDDDERPEVGAFLGWLKTQNPYGPLALASPEVYSDEGDLMGHATRALTPAT